MHTFQRLLEVAPFLYHVPLTCPQDVWVWGKHGASGRCLSASASFYQPGATFELVGVEGEKERVRMQGNEKPPTGSA